MLGSIVLKGQTVRLARKPGEIYKVIDIGFEIDRELNEVQAERIKPVYSK
jgi:hypothetical protein